MTDHSDLLHTPEAQETARKYADILHASRPDSEESRMKYPRMSLENRAKIFAGFRALRGYEEKLAEEDWKKGRVPMPILSDTETEQLSQKLAQIEKGDETSVTFFQIEELDPDNLPWGRIHTLQGTVEKLDAVLQVLRISNQLIPFDCLLDLTIVS